MVKGGVRVFVSILDWIQKGMKVMGGACLVGMALLTCADIFRRNAFNNPIFGSEELVAIMAALVVSFSLAGAHAERAHIGVEIFMRLFSRKKQGLMYIMTTIASFLLFLIVSWRIFVYAGTMKESGEVSMNLELPFYYIIYVMSFCFFMFSLFILKDIIFYFSEKEGE